MVSVMKKRRWQNLPVSNSSEVRYIAWPVGAGLRRIFFFLTNQTKVQMLEYGQTTRKVKVSRILSPSSPKQKGKKNTWSQVNSHQSMLHKNYFFYCEHFNFPIKTIKFFPFNISGRINEVGTWDFNHSEETNSRLSNWTYKPESTHFYASFNLYLLIAQY